MQQDEHRVVFLFFPRFITI